MRVVEKIFFDQVFKIAMLQVLTELLIILLALEILPRLPAIEPGIQRCQRIHESLWCTTIIRLPILELIMIDRGQKRLLVEALLHDVTKRLLDHLQELLLLCLVGTFRRHGKIWLSDTILEAAIDVLADACIGQCLLQRRTGCG